MILSPPYSGKLLTHQGIFIVHKSRWVNGARWGIHPPNPLNLWGWMCRGALAVDSRVTQSPAAVENEKALYSRTKAIAFQRCSTTKPKPRCNAQMEEVKRLCQIILQVRMGGLHWCNQANLHRPSSVPVSVPCSHSRRGGTSFATPGSLCHESHGVC